MPIALYARVSTTDQHSDIQLDALRAYGRRRRVKMLEFVDHGVSGRRDKRKALGELLDAVRRREVNAVAITKLDRLARSTRHLCELAGEFEAVRCDLVVLDQAIDTGTPTGKLLFSVLGAVAEFEADLIQERTRAGLAAAKRRGVKLGRPRKQFDKRHVARARRLNANGRSVREIADVLDISKTMAHRMLTASA